MKTSRLEIIVEARGGVSTRRNSFSVYFIHFTNFHSKRYTITK
jgi:hypothetical protein